MEHKKKKGFQLHIIVSFVIFVSSLILFAGIK